MSSEEASDLTPSVSYSFDSFTMVCWGTSTTTRRWLVMRMYVGTAMCDEEKRHKNEEPEQGENWARVRYM